MSKMTFFLMSCFSLLSAGAAAQPHQVSIAPYYGGRQAALSLTFDDGLKNQYTLAFPELKRRGLRATFAIVGSKVGGVMRSSQDKRDDTDGTPCMTWDMLREMAADGQEIASHGWEHRSVTRLDEEQLLQEVERNDSAIIANIGTKPLTYVYPGNNKSDATVAYCEKGRVGSRTFQTSLGSKRTTEYMRQFADSLIAKGQWGVTMTHGILQGYDHFTDAQVLWDFLDYVSTKDSVLWTAPLCDVAAYVKEAAHTTLETCYENGRLTVTPHCDLDSELFHHPLTIVVTDGNGKSQLFDINPFGGKVVVWPGQTESPTMGWSSWNTYRVNISDSLIMRQADAMVALGLKDAGYTYINIDDGYFGGRDKQTGRLKIHATRFPRGMKPVVDHIHGLGLKAGIYSDAGANTCGNWYDKDTIAVGVGLYGHDQQDCDMFFRELDFDFIKIDFCGGSASRNSDHLELSPQERYTAIRQAILNTGRPDVRMNVCRWDYPGTWVSQVASSWRMSRDISPKWHIVKEIIRQNLYLSAYAGAGHYNDMDMLEIGRSLTAEEDRTHFGLWCMMASPLLIGCDMTTLNTKPSTLSLLTNRDLIAIDQDPLGLQAHVVQHDLSTGTYVLAKDLLQQHGLTRAVAFYNPTNEEQAISIDVEDLELGGKVEAKDLFDSSSDVEGEAEANSSLFTNHFSLILPPHGCRIFRLTAERRLPRIRYEAETAYLSCYQELNNPLAVGTAYYAEDSLCSGGMKVVNLGMSAGNDLQWRDVWCNADGDYRITISCPSFPENASLFVSANGAPAQRLKPHDKLTLTLRLRRGINTIRLYSEGPMPDVDYMVIVPPRPVS